MIFFIPELRQKGRALGLEMASNIAKKNSQPVSRLFLFNRRLSVTKPVETVRRTDCGS